MHKLIGMNERRSHGNYRHIMKEEQVTLCRVFSVECLAVASLFDSPLFLCTRSCFPLSTSCTLIMTEALVWEEFSPNTLAACELSYQ